MRQLSRRGLLAALLGTVSIGTGAQAADAEPQAAASAPFEIVLEGPPEPYPHGHAEYRVTVYDGAVADAPPSVMTLASTVEQGAAVAFPLTVTVSIPNDRLESAARPQVSAVVLVVRRPAYVSKAATSLDRNGPTRVKLDAIEERR